MFNNEDKSFMDKYTKLEKGSDEWKICEFKLQLSLGTTSATVKEIRDIKNAHLGSAFSSYANGSIIL